MSRAITGLLRRAATENHVLGCVPGDTMMALAAEGYDLGGLDADVEKMEETHDEA